MKRKNIAIMAMLALTAGQAFAQRCLPQMKGIEVKVGMADEVYNGKKSCKAGYTQHKGEHDCCLLHFSLLLIKLLD
jgi:hypothetical protein